MLPPGPEPFTTAYEELEALWNKFMLEFPVAGHPSIDDPSCMMLEFSLVGPNRLENRTCRKRFSRMWLWPATPQFICRFLLGADGYRISSEHGFSAAGLFESPSYHPLVPHISGTLAAITIVVELAFIIVWICRQVRGQHTVDFTTLNPNMAFGARATLGYLFNDSCVEVTGFTVPANSKFQALVAKSKASPRKPFIAGAQELTSG